MARSKVAILRVAPHRILEDLDRLHGLAGVEAALDRGAATILKDNISWHFPFPAANTTPWQLEGTIRALRARGYHEQICVQNKTVVTNAFKGEDLNRYVPIFKRYEIPVLYNFEPKDMTWSIYRPKAKMRVLDKIFPEGISIPDFFVGKNIVHLPTVKCVDGDTEVILGDGSVSTIRDLFQRATVRGGSALLDADGAVHVTMPAHVMAMIPNGEIRPRTVAVLSRSSARGRKIVQLRTRSGRSLTCTADHLLRRADGWCAAGELQPGERIAMARCIAVKGESQPLPQTFAHVPQAPILGRGARVYDAAFAQRAIDSYQAGETVTTIAGGEGVRWQSIQSVLKRHGVVLRRNVTQIKIPTVTSSGFWRWMGYFLAEGCVERSHKCDKFWWVNSEPAIFDEYVRLSRELFGVQPGVGGRGKAWISSKQLGGFFEELGLDVPLRAGNKRVPPALFRCPDSEIAAFLSGYLDGDGTVGAKQAEVSAVTKSQRLARDLQILFTRLGVVAFIRKVKHKAQGWTEPRTYWHVVASGAQVKRLHAVLSLRHPTKRQRLAEHVSRLETSNQPSNWDVVPWQAETVKGLRNGLGLTQASTGMASSMNNVENGYTLPTMRIARQLLEVFRGADHDGRHAEELDALAVLAHEDLAWDVVESVEDVTGEDLELYDVTVPDAGCFIGNGLVVHNCHIYTQTTGAMKNAFGGLLNTKRHYTHSWIHETLVDLLAIQKEIHAGLFAVMDGTTAGDGPGPRTMRPVQKDVMLASADQVAIDAVAAAMMGFDPMSLPYIALAHEQGLGTGKLADIEIVGDTALAQQRWGFSVGDNGASKIGDLIWFGPLKRFQKLFFHTPLVNVFVAGSELYHDYYRWPLRDRQVFENWMTSSPWGQLFQQYGRDGVLADPKTVATSVA